MLNEKTTASETNDHERQIAERARHALPAAILPAEMVPLAERARAILGDVNALASDVGRLQDSVCAEYRPSVHGEALRWLELIEHLRADLARLLAGPASCEEEFEAALAGLRENGDGRVWLAMQRHIIATAYAEEAFCPGGVGSFHTGGNGAVLSAIGEAPRVTRKRQKPVGAKASRKGSGGKVRK